MKLNSHLIVSLLVIYPITSKFALYILKQFIMTKFALTVVIFFSLATITYGQNKAEKYCEVTSKHAFGKRIVASISFGYENPLSTDTSTSEIIEFIKTSKFKSDVDILNFMTSQGWSLRSSCSYEDVSNGTSFGSTFFFYFAKMIEKN